MRDTSNEVEISENMSVLPECTRCEAMFRSKDLYEAHRQLCLGGMVRLSLFSRYYYSSTGTSIEFKIQDQTRYCKICGVKKESKLLMEKHLMEHCDMKNGKCMDCEWVSGKYLLLIQYSHSY